MCDPYAGAVDQDVLLMDGNTLPCQACFQGVFSLIGCMDWPDPPIMLS